MHNLLIPSIPVLIMLVFFGLAAGLVFVSKKMLQKGRRTPLTRDMLRNPGESLRDQVEDLGLDITGYLLGFVSFPLIFGFQILFSSQFASLKISLGNLLFYTIIIIGFSAYTLIKTVRLMRKRQSYRLGLECEMAVGQELNQLMLNGCKVYHDFPAEDFNIDHTIIGPAGVYAVKTKGRAKPDKGRGAGDVKVIYDGKSLQFPDWAETEPIAQARRQAQWLANWLKSAVGQQVPVQPALALPGWFIERKAPDMVVFNSKNPQFLAKPKGQRVLADEMIQRIAHQVEQRCRDVEPISYGKKRKK